VPSEVEEEDEGEAEDEIDEVEDEAAGETGAEATQEPEIEPPSVEPLAKTTDADGDTSRGEGQLRPPSQPPSLRASATSATSEGVAGARDSVVLENTTGDTSTDALGVPAPAGVRSGRPTGGVALPMMMPSAAQLKQTKLQSRPPRYTETYLLPRGPSVHQSR
jgi:hypothetical protein